MNATGAMRPQPDDADVRLLERLAEATSALEAEIGKRVIGQRATVEGLLIALLADGHALLVGVPGLAKTLLISTLAEALDLKFSRIQFTPDLMPSDITGTEVLEEDRSTGRRLFRFVRGPIFANVVLADEINRTPPKTQAALLQAMQERAVTAAGETMRLDRPFFVLATQNPIEQEGTYPLPEAQLDRFMLELRIGYPTREEEEQVALQTTGAAVQEVRHVLTGPELLELQGLVRRVPAPQSLVSYAVRIARATRPQDPDAPELVRRYVSWGAGPRASQYLVLAAKARAAMSGRGVPTFDDIRAVAPSVLRHRVVTSFQAEADGRDASDVVEELLELSRKWT
ncbi:MAG TPA: MoxR family ATPase [Longimicrobiales bacterium]|nr:MoxR family ATPase [Longimicrobiales bacterium]